MATPTTNPEIKSKFWVENPLYTTDLKSWSTSYLWEWYVKPQEQTQQPIQPTETQSTPNFQDQKTSTFQPAPVPYTDIQKIEQSKVEPISQKETPVKLKGWKEVMLNAQELKMREQNLRNQELQTKTAEKQAKMTDLSNFLANNPDKTSINRYLKINYAPEYKAEYQNTLKAYFKQTDTIKKSQKYSTATPDVIDEAVKTGELIPWTEAYLSLPPEKRQEYEEYSTIKQRSELLAPYQAPKTDFTTILESLKSVFSTNYKKDFQDRLNSSEVTKYTKDLENIDTQIADIDKSIKNIAKERAWVAKWVPSSLQRGQNAQDIQALLDEKNTLINQYTAKKATLDSIKDDINTELEIARIDDENAKQTYMTALSLYNTERSRMDAIEQRNFEEQSKLRAEERQRDFQKEMLKIQQDFETKNQKPKYEIWRDWKMYAIVDWQAQVVKSDMWEILFWEETEDYTSDIRYNDDWTITEVRLYKDGRDPVISTYDVKGDRVTGIPGGIQSIIEQCRVNWQCGQGANDYAEKLWLGRIFWDTYDSKKEYVNSQSPQVWGFAIWNPQQWQGKFKENWHVGIVTNYNDKTGKVTITDWNWDWDEKQKTHDVNLSEITFNWGFYNVQKQPTEFSKEVKDWGDNILNWVEWAKLTSIKNEELRSKVSSYISEKSKWTTNSNISSLKNTLRTITELQNHKWISGAIWIWTKWWIPWSPSADFLAKLEQLTAENFMANIWQMKGMWALSNAEWQKVSASVSSLWATNQSEASFKEELKRLKQVIEWRINATQQETWLIYDDLWNPIDANNPWFFYDKIEETPVQKPQTWSLNQEFEHFISDTDLQWIYNK